MVRVLILGLFTILLFNGEALSTQMVTTASPPRQHIVEIRDFGFHPERTLISPGDTIVWINRDIVPHTVTAGDGSWGSWAVRERAKRAWFNLSPGSTMSPQGRSELAGRISVRCPYRISGEL